MTGSLGLVFEAPGRAAVTTDDVRADAEWIMGAQLADGAIAHYADRTAVWPYLSNFAAMGLVRATEVTGDRRYVDAAWKWLAWYQAHQDANGFVTDYTVTNGVATSTGWMDSTDSYAGTFLLAAKAAHDATQDLAKLRTLSAGIAGAVRAIEATQDNDGLTWAKPTWKVKYLMDQAETWSGLAAGSTLAGILGDTALRDRAATDASRMKSAVTALWDAGLGAYDWAVHESGVRVGTKWSVLYSDSLQQAWAVAFGIVDEARVSGLLNTFQASQPNWALPAATAIFDGGNPQTVGYWPQAGLAFSKGGLRDVAAGAATSIRAAALGSQRMWPFTTGNAGQLIMLESLGLPTPGSPTTTVATTTTTTSTTVKATTTTTTAATTTTTSRRTKRPR